MSELWEVYIVFFIMGYGFSGSIILDKLYVQEFLLKKHRPYVLASGTVTGGLSVCFLVIYFLYITKYW